MKRNRGLLIWDGGTWIFNLWAILKHELFIFKNERNRKVAELEKIFKAEDKKARKRSTGFKGEEPNEKYEPFGLCAPTPMHLCRPVTCRNTYEYANSLPYCVNTSHPTRWTVCPLLCRLSRYSVGRFTQGLISVNLLYSLNLLHQRLLLYGDLIFTLFIFKWFSYQVSILYRGVSPDVLMFDHMGHLQVGSLISLAVLTIFSLLFESPF